MKKTFRIVKIFQVAFSLLIVLLFLGSVYYAFNSFDTQIKAAIIAASVAFGVAITSHFVQKKRELEFKIRERKVEAYQKIFDFMMYFLQASASSAPTEEATGKLVAYIYEINYALIMWGSSDVIIKWADFQVALKNHFPIADEAETLARVFFYKKQTS